MKQQTILFLAFILLFSTFTTIVITEAISANDDTITIVLDPGHGGFDGGAVAPSGLCEKEVTLSITIFLANYLRKTGFRVIMTREIDESLADNKTEDIYARVKLINKTAPTLFLSIHANSYPSPLVKGAQTFYNSKNQENVRLAESIQEMLLTMDPTNHRVAKSISGKYLIDKLAVTGCLVEVGFLTNENESVLLATPSYQAQIALMIYMGVLQYLENIEE